MPAVVFDMDGVLIDSEPYWQEAEVEVFASVGVPLTLEMCRQTTGLRMDAAVDFWFRRYPWTGMSTAEVEHRVKARVGELVALHGRAMEGAVELVDALRATGVPLAICSSSPVFLIDAVCEKLGIRGQFQVLQSAEDCARGKPHPDPYLATAERLAVGPDQCVVVEDSLNGMRSARAAGMRVIGVTTNAGAREDGLCDVVCDQLALLRAEAVLALFSV